MALLSYCNHIGKYLDMVSKGKSDGRDILLDTGPQTIPSQLSQDERGNYSQDASMTNDDLIDIDFSSMDSLYAEPIYKPIMMSHNSRQRIKLQLKTCWIYSNVN